MFAVGSNCGSECGRGSVRWEWKYIETQHIYIYIYHICVGVGVVEMQEEVESFWDDSAKKKGKCREGTEKSQTKFNEESVNGVCRL